MKNNLFYPEDEKFIANLDKQIALMFIRKGYVYMCCKLLDEANAAFNEALKYDPNNADIYFWMSENWLYKYFCEDARQAIEKALAIDNTRAEYWSQLGLIKDSLNSIYDIKTLDQNVIDCFKKAIELQPNWPHLYRNIGV